MTAVAMMFAACNKDEGDTTDPKLVGKWTNTTQTYILDDDTQYFDYAGTYNFTFEKNGKGTYTINYSGHAYDDAFTYTLDGDQLTISSYREEISQTYTVKELTDNHLVFEGEYIGETFNPGSLYHWDLTK